MATPKPNADTGQRFVVNYKYLNNHKAEAEGVLGYFDTEAEAQTMIRTWTKHPNIKGFRILDREAKDEEEDNGSNTSGTD